MRKINFLILILLLLWPTVYSAATNNLPQKLAGRILLQVQSAGRAWYVNPADEKKYYLGRPADAFEIMRRLGLGISQADFNKLSSDKNLALKVKGRILLQVQSAGQAWYINSVDGKKYYLGRPSDAFIIMKRLALGISDADLTQIPEGQLTPQKISDPYSPAPSQKSILAEAAAAIRNNDSPKAESFFTPQMQKIISYTMTALNSESKLLLANILSSAQLEGQTDEQKTYTAQAYFSLGGYNVSLHFYVKKQADGNWLMTNL